MRKSAIKALAAAAGAAAVTLAMAGQASASTPITVTDVGITGNYIANISSLPYQVYSGMMLFTANAAGGTNVPDLDGFCIDISHEINLGGGQGLSYLDTMGDSGVLLKNYADGSALTDTGDPTKPLDPKNQLSAITNLVDTGFLLYKADPTSADTLMNEAAIQAAIWQIENPGITVSLVDSSAQAAFLKYSTGDWVSAVTPEDRVFTLVSQDRHQSFAIGWPVPEPSTWAMMLVGFGGMGAVLRRSRKATAATA
jgi:PEP-CTERM motif